MNAIMRGACLFALLAAGLPASASEAVDPVPAQLHEQLGLRIEHALREGSAHELHFEVVEVTHWHLARDEAEFELWGLVHEDGSPSRMLRVDSRIDRRSLELKAFAVQPFDEFQALSPPSQH